MPRKEKANGTSWMRVQNPPEWAENGKSATSPPFKAP
jgi:hypothetical protein